MSDLPVSVCDVLSHNNSLLGIERRTVMRSDATNDLTLQDVKIFYCKVKSSIFIQQRKI